jgi:hypothetical protein
VSEYDDLLPDEDAPVDPLEPPVEVQAEPPVLADEGDEVPPEPGDALLVPLAERERRKLAAMTPAQRERYDAAQAEIMAHPAVAAFAAEEDRAREAKKLNQEAFLAAYRKKQKEKS